MTESHHNAGLGAVVVDIGGDVGALVLYTDAAMTGLEIEISPINDDTRRSHVAVHARAMPGREPVHAAVYPDLPSGRYQLWHPGGLPAGTVHITAGGVTETTWAAVTGLE